MKLTKAKNFVKNVNMHATKRFIKGRWVVTIFSFQFINNAKPRPVKGKEINEQ